MIPRDGRYRVWAGNPEGIRERPELCIEEVPDGGRSVLFHQCRLKRGHGLQGKFCKRHGDWYWKNNIDPWKD